MIRLFWEHAGLCLWKNLTGLPCPGCGMTRAFLTILHLDIKEALFYHPLFWLVPLIVILLVLRKRVPLFQAILNKQWLIWGVLLLFLVVYGIRFVSLFPNQAPFDYNQYALLPSIWRLIQSE